MICNSRFGIEFQLNFHAYSFGRIPDKLAFYDKTWECKFPSDLKEKVTKINCGCKKTDIFWFSSLCDFISNGNSSRLNMWLLENLGGLLQWHGMIKNLLWYFNFSSLTFVKFSLGSRWIDGPLGWPICLRRNVGRVWIWAWMQWDSQKVWFDLPSGYFTRPTCRSPSSSGKQSTSM